MLLKALLLVGLLKGRLTRGVGGCEHVLWIGSRLGPDHVVAGVVEVGHGRPAQAGRGEDGLVYCIFLQTSSGTPSRHGRRVAVHGRSRLQRKPIRRRNNKQMDGVATAYELESLGVIIIELNRDMWKDDWEPERCWQAQKPRN